MALRIPVCIAHHSHAQFAGHAKRTGLCGCGSPVAWVLADKPIDAAMREAFAELARAALQASSCTRARTRVP